MEKTYTKEGMIEKVTEMLNDGDYDSAEFLIAEAISVCIDENIEVFVTEDEEIIEIMES